MFVLFFASLNPNPSSFRMVPPPAVQRHAHHVQEHCVDREREQHGQRDHQGPHHQRGVLLRLRAGPQDLPGDSAEAHAQVRWMAHQDQPTSGS